MHEGVPETRLLLAPPVVKGEESPDRHELLDGKKTGRKGELIFTALIFAVKAGGGGGGCAVKNEGPWRNIALVGQQAGGTHPNGMHSCFVKFFMACIFWKINLKNSRILIYEILLVFTGPGSVGTGGGAGC